MKNYHVTQNSAGFTVVELIITVIASGIFILAFVQLFGSISSSTSNARQKSIASELAYSYLRKYTGSGTNPATWFTCSTATGSANTNDYTVNSNATGQILTSGTLSSVEGLPPPVSYEVTALALYGCSGTNIASPLRIEAKVTYGPKAKQVRHATLQRY